jgi:hypothetical protein
MGHKIVFILFSFLALTAFSQVFIPMAFWGAKRGALTISDGATFDYGTVAAGATSDHVFTLTNTSYVQVTGVSGTAFTGTNPTNFSYKGGSFPGVGGDCTSSLVGYGACTFVVTASSASAATRNANINVIYNDGVSSQTATRAVKATFTTTPTRLVWLNPPDYIKFNTCVQLTVQAQDNSGNAVNVGSAVTVNLAINNTSNPKYYTTSSCGTQTTSISISSGSNSANVWIKTATANESGILVASATALVGATQNVYFTNNPSVLSMYTPPEAQTNLCYPVQIYAEDATGIPAVVSSNLTVNLATTGSNIFYSNGACTSVITSTIISTGSYLQVVYTMDLFAQTVTATASATGYTTSTESIAFSSTVDWWDTSWQKRIRIDINNLDQSTAFSDQPVLVSLDSSIINYADFKTNGADIRFVASDETTPLDYEIERWDATGTSQVWVRIPAISASSDKGYFYLYYNNPSATDDQDANGVWTDYWAVWHLNENPSGSAPQYLDSTANGRNGTASATAPSRVIGVIGNSADLSNSADYIQINTNLQPIIGNDSTFSCWMRTTQTGAGTSWQSPGITGIERSGSVDDIFFGSIDTAGNIGVGVGDDARSTSGFVINNNAWRHVSITRNKSTGKVTFYVNGVQTGSGTSRTGEIDSMSGGGVAFDRLGAIISGQNYNGQLDEVRLMDTVQSAAKIKADFKYMMNTHLNYGAVELQ